MNKIYDELEYAKILIEKGFEKFPSTIELNILSKYYRSIGMNSSEIKKEIISFCQKWDNKFNLMVFENKIDFIIKKSSKYELKTLVDIPITKKEIEKIKELKNYRYEKIVFVMLVISKYNYITGGKKYNNYYFSGKLSGIYRMAHVSQMKNENIGYLLYKAGYIIDTQKRDNFKIAFTDNTDDSEVQMIINKMDDIYLFWKQTCSMCGREINKKSKKQTYCSDCAEEREKNRLHEFYVDSRNKIQTLYMERNEYK